MKQKLLKAITSAMLILTLTSTNFIFLCANFVTYAADVININKNTNHKNVEFMVYFKDENENRITEKNVFINNDNLKLYFQISVKKEGYFNGKAILNNSNFKFKTDILDASISKIEDNIIYFNQINAGETTEIPVEIEILKNDVFDLDLIDFNSDVLVEGIYRDSTQKDISIETKRNVSLILSSPYTDENVELSQEVITNKIFKIDGQDKRVIQVMINSGMKDNLFPVNKAIINIQAPKISNIYPETVLVNSNDILVTNGKYLTQDNWSYDNQTGLIKINIENSQKDGNVSWLKTGKDNFIITYIFDKNVQINNERLVINSEIQLYDINKTILKASNGIYLSRELKSSIFTTNIIQNETNIYKGKLETQKERDIVYKSVININLNKVIDEVNLEEKKQTLGNYYLKSVYKTTKISKANLDRILGDDGSLEIINIVNAETIMTINKNSVADGNGDIIVKYPDGVETVKFKIKSPRELGKVELETTKTIYSENATALRNENKIILKALASYVTDNDEIYLPNIESIINLNETQTFVDFQINRTQLSAMFLNDNVEFRITLKSREENEKLFRNPILKIQLPEKIENIKVNSINLLYENELKIKSATLNNKAIEIALEGEQTKYKEEAVEGAIIIINADLQTNRRIPSSTEKVKLFYTNKVDTGNVERNIEIVSYAGVVTTNQISEYGVELINNEGKDIAQLTLSDTEKKVKIEKKLINNKENEIKNVKILGVFPTEQVTGKNNIKIEVGSISIAGIDSNRAKIYYSNKENATKDLQDENNEWKSSIEDSKAVRKYLVVVDKLDILEELDLSYSITIPANLEYNQTAEEGYTVYYDNMTIEEKIDTKAIRLETPAGAIVDTTLKALVAGQDATSVKENEVLRYKLTVANTGSEDVTNIIVKAKVPEGTRYVNTQYLNNEVDIQELEFVDENKKELEFVIEKLNCGEKIEKYYEVQVKEDMSGRSITNSVTTKYGEATKISDEVKTLVEDGTLELRLISVDAKDNIVKSGHQYRYVLQITNKSNKDMKKVKATINTNEVLNVSKIYYINSDGKAIIKNNVNDIEIAKIRQGETIEVAINTTVSIFKNTTSKDVTITASANYNETIYNSNEIDMRAKSDLLFSLDVTSENADRYVKAGDIIKYNVTIKNVGDGTVNVLTLNNWLSNDVTLTKVIKDGVELTKEQYSLRLDSSRHQKVLKILNEKLEPGKSVQYQIEVVANLIYGSTSATEIVSEYSLNVEAYEIANVKIIHVLASEGSDYEEDKDKVPDVSNPEVEEKEENKIIYGVAWLDENENGQKDMSEKTIEGMDVKLLNTKTNEFVKDSEGNILTAKTTATGFYNFSEIKKGEYIVIFEYDHINYWLTDFEKEGVLSEVNSNVITKTMNIDGIEKKVAVTEIIDVVDENISNINIGLIKAKKYDLELNKYITKVTVQNNKVESHEYTASTLVKQEIDAKQINSTTVIVEYTIKVTNKGDVTAYAKKLTDYLPTDYKFNSQLNKDWYQSGNNVYCTSLANEPIQPGESKEVVLTVIKEMNENNIGLINNTAEIEKSYNELGLLDIDSIEGNQVKNEDDTGSADLIISIKTGQVVMTVFLIVSSIVMLGIAIILLKRILRSRKLF